MTKIGEYLADKGWLTNAPAGAPVGAASALAAGPMAGALADKQPSAVDVLKMNAAKDPGLVEDQFKASAVREGVSAFRDMVKAVDFPKFVASLVQGVFRAVVEASIQQMQAFAELLAASAKTVDQFAGENISDAMARDFIANQHPDAVRIDSSGEYARLRPSSDDGGEGVGQAFGVPGVDLSDDEGEMKLVLAAKQQMARWCSTCAPPTRRSAVAAPRWPTPRRTTRNRRPGGSPTSSGATTSRMTTRPPYRARWTRPVSPRPR
jgi:hypothetical protein